jgi:hypothetical protein
VWARRGVNLGTCPRSLITAESQTTVEDFFIRRRLGLMNEEHLTARQVEAFAILERELAAEIKYEHHNARAAS